MQKMIADRYEILDLIGQGGMADVYLAKDIILNRTIAIKILRTGLAKDPIYVTRFQREASAAAALSHKNIVDIYDVGEEREQYYIVMEYVPGRTLKELINKRGALHVVEAIDIMKQVVSGTTKAHQLGIVHRDLKPQNILVTDSGVAKIADFGIASMQSLAQVTQTDVIMGSLHYLAPELARGEKATSQSDIYALGIVLYELLRGEVPFNGESPVNIALKHMQEELPSIRSFNPSIPQSVENIIIRATAKNLKDRYQSAQDILADIEGCMEREEQKVVFAYNQNENPTIVLSGRDAFNGQAINEMPSKTESLREEEEKGFFAKLAALPIAAKAGIAMIVILVAVALTFIIVSNNNGKTVTMPDVVGKTQADAVQEVETVGLVVKVEEEPSDAYEEGEVISSDPTAGSNVKKGEEVILIVSSGQYIVVGDYVGISLEEAEEALQKLGFEVLVKEDATSSKPKNEVLEQSIQKGEKLDPNEENRTITLTVSRGKEIVLEDYRGMSYEKAYERLSALGFKVEKDERPSDEAEGTVLYQSKSAGTIFTEDDDKTIVLTIAIPKPANTVVITNVYGYAWQDAKTVLTNLGLVVKTQIGKDAPTAEDVGTVYAMTPDAGATVEEGTSITITYYGTYSGNTTTENPNTETEE